jgi:uncharacterized cupredoxin-like copper-binding protein
MKRRLLFGINAILLLLVLAACGGTTGSTSSSGAQQVQITENEFKIDSPVTTFSSGATYHFVVTNTGKTAHEFMIMPKSEGSMSGMPMQNMDKMALVAIDNISPGETKTIDYTFPSSTANSHPQFACYLPGHYEAGMKLDVNVKA